MIPSILSPLTRQRRSHRPSLTLTSMAGVALLTGGALLGGCNDDASAARPGSPTTQRSGRETQSVRVAPVSREPFPELVDFVGTVFGDEESLIASKVSGRVLETRVDIGDRVADGTVLLVIDPTDAQLEVRQRERALQEALAKIGLTEIPDDSFDISTIATVRRAAVQAQNAKSRLDRATQLYESKPQPLISQQDYDDTRTQFAVAQQDLDVAMLEARTALATARSRAAELAVARQALADTQIRAPQDPTTRPSNAASQPSAPDRWAVAERRVSIGEYLAPGSVVYRLVTDQPIKLRAAVPERFLNVVKKDQPVSLWIDASSRPHSGAISRVSPAVDVNGRTFVVEMTFANARHELKPGGFGRGEITVGQRTDVTTIPPQALYSFAGLDKVFTIKDGKVVATVVKVVAKNDQRVVIEGSLGGADQVIVSGLAHLANGDPVKVEGAQ